MDPSYNNSFGGASAFNQPAVGQPVVLSGAKKKHTGVVILVILLCLAIVGAVIFFLISRSGSNIDIIQRYKNYIITGNEYAQDTEERYNSDDIWFRDVYYNGEDSEWSALYEKANSMLDTISANEEMASKVTSQKEMLRMLNFDREIGENKMSLFTSTYIDGGENGIYKNILYKIDDFRNSNNDYAVEYYQRFDDLSNATVKYAEYFRNAGCNIDIVESLGECYGQFEQNIEGFDVEAENIDEIALWQGLMSGQDGVRALISYSVDNYISDAYDIAINNNGDSSDEKK